LPEVDTLSLHDALPIFRRSYFASADGPNGFVCDDNLPCVLLGQALQRSIDLSQRVGNLVTRLTNVQSLAHAEYRHDSLAKCRGNLGGRGFIIFTVILATLGVSHQRVGDTEFLQHYG